MDGSEVLEEQFDAPQEKIGLLEGGDNGIVVGRGRKRNGGREERGDIGEGEQTMMR